MSPLLVIIGPSGSGKSTLARELVSRGCIRLLPTWTTRPPRADELGVGGCPEHRFVHEDQFERMEQSRHFLASGSLPGLGYRYGLLVPPAPYPGLIDAVIVRAPYVEQLRAIAGRSVLVYQIESDPESLRSRVAGRGLSAAEVEARAAAADGEIATGRRVADRVFVNSGTVEQLVRKVEGAVRWDAGVDQRPLPVAQSRTRQWVREQRSVWHAVGIAVTCVVAIAGLALLALGILVAVGMGNWGNNK